MWLQVGLFHFMVFLLSCFEEERCQNLAAYLGLPPLLGAPTVQAQRERIANYLGVVF